MVETILTTRLGNLPPVVARCTTSSPLTAQEKKDFRLEASVNTSGENVGFLHAALIRVNDKHFLLAGPSHVGKTYYGDGLLDTYKGKREASDWVAVEKRPDGFFASDLNEYDKIRHEGPCKVDGVVFLTFDDGLNRDAFAPNTTELKMLLGETFDTANPSQLEALGTFWMRNAQDIPYCSVVPARGNTQEYIAKTIQILIERQKLSRKQIDVGVIGLGSIGQALAFQLGMLPQVSAVSLNTRTKAKAVGVALDMNHAMPDGKIKYHPYASPEDVIDKSSLVFMTFRDEAAVPNLDLPERWRKASAHIRIAGEMARAASNRDFKGTIMMITNPVDYLTHSIYAQSQQDKNPLRTFQVIGAGLELDRARALYWAKEMGLPVGNEDIRIFGNHGEVLQVKSGLGEDVDRSMQEYLKQASPEVRKYVERTIYGPVGAVVQTFLHMIRETHTYATLLQEGTYIGREAVFRNFLPMLGVSYAEDPEYAKIITNNKSLQSLKN